MIKTQGDRNLIANMLGIISAFVVYRLSFSLDDSGLLAVPLACLAMPVIPVLYSFTVAWRRNSTLRQFLKSPEASRVTNAMIFLCSIALIFGISILLSYGWDTFSKAIRSQFTLPDSLEYLALSCLAGIFYILLGLWPKGKVITWPFPRGELDPAKSQPTKDHLAMRIMGVSCIVFATTLFLAHVLAENVLGYPIITFTQKRGWGGIVILFVPLVAFNILNALSDTLARRIRQRRASNQRQPTSEVTS